MSLEQQLSDAIQAQNALTHAVASKMGEIDAATAAQTAALNAWRDSARSEYPAVNLLSNSRFLTDTNADGMPDGFYSYYPCSAAPPTLSLISPDGSAAAGSDARIASNLLATAFGSTYWGFPSGKVLKVNFASSTPVTPTGQWSLGQVYPNNARLLSRGIYGYVKCVTAPTTFGVLDCPGGDTHVFGTGAGYLPAADGINKVVKFCPNPSTVTSATLGFLFLASGITAGTTIYLAAPWFANGFVNDYPSSIEGR